MPVTEAQKRATAKYRKENTKQIILRFYPADHELWEWVRAQGGAPWVRELLCDMMGREEQGSDCEV